MTSRCDRQGVVELARGQTVDPALERHVEQCGACRALLRVERALSADLRALAETTAAAGPRAALEGELLSALAASRRRVSPARTWWVAAAALALAVSGAVYMVAELAPSGSPGGASGTGIGSAFVPWPGSEVLPRFESGQLVRVELPASVLPLLGLEPVRAAAGTVEADVLVGQDGFARAVRLAP
jgi:hypothetical protein